MYRSKKWDEPTTMEEVNRRRAKFGNKITPEDEREICELWSKGLLTNKKKRELAERIGCDIKTIWRTHQKERLAKERERRKYRSHGYHF